MTNGLVVINIVYKSGSDQKSSLEQISGELTYGETFKIIIIK